jgi:hypothetical protein
MIRTFILDGGVRSDIERGTAVFLNEDGTVSVLDPAAAPPAPEKKPEEKESVEDIERRARKPPSDGPCKGCGKNLPLNRLMLCFRCWVNKNLNDDAKARGEDFLPGIDPHPAWCGCELPEHAGRRP